MKEQHNISIFYLADTIILEYYKKFGVTPTAFILECIMYYCQIEYMKKNNGQCLYEEDLLCSSIGGRIESVDDRFVLWHIQPIPLDYLVATKNTEILHLIKHVLTMFPKEILTHSVALRDTITLNKKSAWYLQKEEDHAVKNQPIKLKYLKKEAKK